MRCTIVLEFDNGDGSVVKRAEVMRFHRAAGEQAPGDVGLTLAEGKSLLNCVQQQFVVEQIERYCASRRSCADCGGLSNVVTYLQNNVDSLIDYRTWQRAGCRISTGFVESSINRIVGRRMGKSQHMCWSRPGAHSVVQLRVALLNREFHELAQRLFPWIGQRRITWPWEQTSRGF
ncbi:hypothetical protein [Burkholderia sp. Ac-20344]|uniref:hypothetical protein n=1 Tax=Burkholderia sp. Ac-20344 TaxID=2703890 RepID=UPI00197C24BE|nr:hypothetical protein [Burkholderia sp. Ac-20344]MBN3831916.1 hypothetical protein [Burkholderia sp. Ac-20344]